MMILIPEKQCVPLAKQTVILSCGRAPFCLESVSGAGVVYSLGTLEQGVMFPFLSAAEVEGNEINERWRLKASGHFSKM